MAVNLTALSKVAATTPGLSGMPGSVASGMEGSDLFAQLLGAQLGDDRSLQGLGRGKAARRGADEAVEPHAADGKEGQQTGQPLCCTPILVQIEVQRAQQEAAPQAAQAAARVAASGLVDEANGPLVKALRQQALEKKLPQAGEADVQFLPQVAMAQNGARQAAAHAALQLNVPAPLARSPEWAERFAGQMMGMVQLKVDSAQIQVNPPHLGPIDVSLKLNNEQVQVSFVAATPAAREALEHSLPRLSAMLAESGLLLADAQVSYGQQRQQQEQAARQSQPLPEDEVFVAELGAVPATDGLSIRA